MNKIQRTSYDFNVALIALLKLSDLLVKRQGVRSNPLQEADVKQLLVEFEDIIYSEPSPHHDDREHAALELGHCLRNDRLPFWFRYLIFEILQFEMNEGEHELPKEAIVDVVSFKNAHRSHIDAAECQLAYSAA